MTKKTLTVEQLVELWDAINHYTETCGGDTSAHIGSIKRQKAVVRVQAVISKIMEEYEFQDEEKEPEMDTGGPKCHFCRKSECTCCGYCLNDPCECEAEGVWCADCGKDPCGCWCG